MGFFRGLIGALSGSEPSSWDRIRATEDAQFATQFEGGCDAEPDIETCAECGEAAVASDLKRRPLCQHHVDLMLRDVL